MARPRSKKTSAEKRRKKVNVSLITKRDSQPYKIMAGLVKEHHKHLADAKIAIAWRFGWKADVDKVIRLVQVVKGSDLSRELAEWDFVILLNHEVWNVAGFSALRMEATLYHALCRCQVAKDRDGETVEDEKKRTVYRLRKPTIVEFPEVIRRYGAYTQDLQDFMEAASEAAQRPLLAKQLAAEVANPAASHEANGKPRNGTSSLYLLKAAPSRIKLLRTIRGHSPLHEGTEHEVIPGGNGKIAVVGQKGKIVELAEDAYTVVG